jgi:hypothetical protein
MSSEGSRNILMYFGSMSALLTFWLVVLGLQNHSPLQLAGAVATLAITIFCVRSYVAELRKDRRDNPPGGSEGHEL